MRSAENPYTVTFVCSGNICRSPIAEYVVRDLLRREGLADLVRVDSAGIGDWHVGHRADRRALAVLREHGLDASGHRARQLDPDELGTTDLVVAMDGGHARALQRYAQRHHQPAHVRMMRSFDPRLRQDQSGGRFDGFPPELDVADPYYDEDAAFRNVLEQVRSAAPGLVAEVRRVLSGEPSPPPDRA
ncbi:MAG: low molecular weight protein-tyrosine-phosphatase [Actinomycetes bacterium]